MLKSPFSFLVFIAIALVGAEAFAETTRVTRKVPRSLLLKKFSFYPGGSCRTESVWRVKIAIDGGGTAPDQGDLTGDDSLHYTFEALPSTSAGDVGRVCLELGRRHIPSTISVERSQGRIRRVSSTWPLLLPGDTHRRRAHLMAFSVLAASGVLYESWETSQGCCGNPPTTCARLFRDYTHIQQRRTHIGGTETVEFGPLQESLREPHSDREEDILGTLEKEWDALPSAVRDPSTLLWTSLPSNPQRCVTHLYNALGYGGQVAFYGVGSLPDLSGLVIANGRHRGIWKSGDEFVVALPGIWVICKEEDEAVMEEHIEILLGGFSRHFRVKLELDPNNFRYKPHTDDHSSVLAEWAWRLQVNGTVVAQVADKRDILTEPDPQGDLWTRTMVLSYSSDETRKKTKEVIGLLPSKFVLTGRRVAHQCLLWDPSKVSVSFHDEDARIDSEALKQATKRVLHLLAGTGFLEDLRRVERTDTSRSAKPGGLVSDLRLVRCEMSVGGEEPRVVECDASTLFGPADGRPEWHRVVFTGRRDTDVFISYLEEEDCCVRLKRIGRAAGPSHPLAYFIAVDAGVVEYVPLTGEEVDARYGTPAHVLRLELVAPRPLILRDFLLKPLVEKHRKRVAASERARKALAKRAKYRIAPEIDAKLSDAERRQLVWRLEQLHSAKEMYFLEKGADAPAPTWQDLAPYVRGGMGSWFTPDYTIGVRREPILYGPVDQ